MYQTYGRWHKKHEQTIQYEDDDDDVSDEEDGGIVEVPIV